MTTTISGGKKPGPKKGSKNKRKGSKKKK